MAAVVDQILPCVRGREYRLRTCSVSVLHSDSKAPDYVSKFLETINNDERLKIMLHGIVNGREKRGHTETSLRTRLDDATFLVKQVLHDDLGTLMEHVISKNNQKGVVLETAQSQLIFFTETRLRDWQAKKILDHYKELCPGILESFA
jgi:hypothetical protein